jgi:hypothetical protein
LGADGLVVLIVLREESIGLPMREVMLGLIRLFVVVDDLFVTVFRELLFDWLFEFLNKLEVLPDAPSLFRFELLGLMVLPMREVMLGLILLFVLFLEEAEELLGERLTALRLLMLLRLDWLDVGELGRTVICRPSVLEFGAVERELTDRFVILLLDDRLVTTLFDMLLVVLGARLVMTRLELLLRKESPGLLGVRFVTVRLEMLLLPDDRFVMALLELVLLVFRLAVIRFELRLDEMLLELLEEFDLEIDLDEAAGLEDCRLCCRELLDLLLLDRVLAARAGSQNNKRAKNVLKNR